MNLQTLFHSLLIAAIPLVVVPDSYFGMVACVEFVVVVVITIMLNEKNNSIDMKSLE